MRTSRTLAIGTSVRIAACPAIMALLLARQHTAALLVFLLAAVTDWFDGRLARRWHAVTKLGAFLDTTADKLLVCTAMLALVAIHRASAWVALVIVGRELTILGLRAAVIAAGAQFQTSQLGRVKATVQFIAIALAIVRPDVVLAGAFLDEWALGVAAVITAASGIDYLVRCGPALAS